MQNKSDPKPHIGAAALIANIDYYRSMRIKAHSEYLKAKRLERAYIEHLHKLEKRSDSSFINAG